MKTLLRSWSLRFFAASLIMAALPVSAQEAEGVIRIGPQDSTGVARVSDHPQTEPTVRGQSADEESQFSIQHVNYASGSAGGAYCPPTQPGPYMCSDNRCMQWLACNLYMCKLRQQQACSVLHASCKEDLREKANFLRCKFGYFCPSGGDGAGVPPWGCYNMVYPVNPSHFDGRDGQVYAAPGQGGPVSVPIAPVVNHTYNYGWGIPSSRLTPIAHPLTPGVPVP